MFEPTLPRRMALGAHRWSLSEVAGTVFDKQDPGAEEGYVHLGLCDPFHHRIVIRRDVGGATVAFTRRAEATWHEVMHAAWSQTNLPEEVEEGVIRALAPVLLEALRRNQALAFYLTG